MDDLDDDSDSEKDDDENNADVERLEREIMEAISNNNDKKDFFEYTEECFRLCSKVVIPTYESIKENLVTLPFISEMKKQKKKLVVWDLDETLIHCIQDDPSKAQIQLEVKFSAKSTKKVNN